MKLHLLALENFRNISSARLHFSGLRHFFQGPNGQGKSNLLEAISLCGALRSFRGAESRTLIARGGHTARLLYQFSHEKRGETELEIAITGGSRQVKLDGERVSALSALIGLFPSIVMHGGDLHLLEGAPAERRRFLDLHLSVLDRDYLADLKRYHSALSGRNRLLKKTPLDQAQLGAFEQLMAQSGVCLRERRSAAMTVLQSELREYYEKISPVSEEPELVYCPRLSAVDEAEYREMLSAERQRDAILGSTRIGPHRDDFRFGVLGEAARGFASEGQKRGLVLSLRLAQCSLVKKQLQIMPILLADDIIGELDEERRRRFWQCFDAEMQLMATGTSAPETDLNEWSLYATTEGRFEPETQEGAHD